MTARMSMLVFPVFAWGVLGDRHKAKCGKGVRSPLTSPAHLTDGIRRKGMTGPCSSALTDIKVTAETGKCCKVASV